MTIKAFAEAPLARPVPMVPVAKPRGGKMPTTSSTTLTSSSASSPHYANYVNYNETSTSKHGGAIPKKSTSASEAESSNDSTASVLNEAADAVAKYFGKLTQGINKGKKPRKYVLHIFVMYVAFVAPYPFNFFVKRFTSGNLKRDGTLQVNGF